MTTYRWPVEDASVGTSSNRTISYVIVRVDKEESGVLTYDYDPKLLVFINDCRLGIGDVFFVRIYPKYSKGAPVDSRFEIQELAAKMKSLFPSPGYTVETFIENGFKGMHGILLTRVK